MMASEMRRAALTVALLLESLCLGCHGTPTNGDQGEFRAIDGTFQNRFPGSLSPGQTVTLHVACRVNTTPAGPFHAYLEIFADKNLVFQSVSATSSTRPMATLNGTEYPAFDNIGIGFYFGPPQAGAVPFADLVYRVVDNPIDYPEPAGVLSAHMGTALNPDPNLDEGYSFGVAIDSFIPIILSGS